MALVQYSDSEPDTDDDKHLDSRPAKKIRRETPTDNRQVSSLPPLPTAFHDLYASSTRVSVRDDPSLHGGRKRVIPHVEGNWPTHIYLEWYPTRDDLAILNDIILQTEDMNFKDGMNIQSLLYSDLGAQLPLHISLSRPVVLRTEQRHSFAETLEKGIRNSHVQPFDITPDSLDWVSNYEKTRWFLVLRVLKPKDDNLNRLLEISNRSLALFHQPPLYGNSASAAPKGSGDDHSHCFHISLAWTLTEPSSAVRERVASIDLRKLRDFIIHLNSAKAKIGNNVSNIPLSVGVRDEKTIGGL